MEFMKIFITITVWKYAIVKKIADGNVTSEWSEVDNWQGSVHLPQNTQKYPVIHKNTRNDSKWPEIFFYKI